MNAPAFTRRRFTAGLGALVVAFSLDPQSCRWRQERLPGSLQNNRMLDAWIRINRRRHRDRLHRQGRTGAGHPHRARADRRRGARSAARSRQDDLRRHRPDAERGSDRRQPVDREQRHGVAHGRRRGCARSCSTSRRSSSASAADQLKVADGVISAPDGRKVSYGELAATPISIARRRPRRRRSRPRATRSSANRLRASTFRPR